jgi:hypothetical protein
VWLDEGLDVSKKVMPSSSRAKQSKNFVLLAVEAASES